LSLTIFLDTDFLSAFLKIEQLHLVTDMDSARKSSSGSFPDYRSTQ